MHRGEEQYAFCLNGNSDASTSWSNIKENTILSGGGTSWEDLGFTQNYISGATTVILNVTKTPPNFSAIPINAFTGGQLSMTTQTGGTAGHATGTYRIKSNTSVAANTPGPMTVVLFEPLNGFITLGGAAGPPSTGDVATLIYGKCGNMWPCRTVDVPAAIAQTYCSVALPYFWCQFKGRTSAWLAVDTTVPSQTSNTDSNQPAYTTPMPGASLFLRETGTPYTGNNTGIYARSDLNGQVVNRPTSFIQMQLPPAWQNLAINDVVEQATAGPLVTARGKIIQIMKIPAIPATQSYYIVVNVQHGEFSTLLGRNIAIKDIAGTARPGPGPPAPPHAVTSNLRHIACWMKDQDIPVDSPTGIYAITADILFLIV